MAEPHRLCFVSSGPQSPSFPSLLCDWASAELTRNEPSQMSPLSVFTLAFMEYETWEKAFCGRRWLQVMRPRMGGWWPLVPVPADVLPPGGQILILALPPPPPPPHPRFVNVFTWLCRVLVEACRIFVVSCGLFHCGTESLVAEWSSTWRCPYGSYPQVTHNCTLWSCLLQLQVFFFLLFFFESYVLFGGSF